ncbi:MAG: multiprotein bridging factor aMBF1 [Nitrososphaeria archaeon]
MNCEICGKRIDGRPRKVMVDGSILEVCTSCVTLGEKEMKEAPRKVATSGQRVSTDIGKIDLDEMEIVPDYPSIVKKAREKMGLSQDDLAQKLNEKASVIRLIESGKMKPNIFIGRKLERYLKVNLFTVIEEE